jgi:NAD(P)-dependent dehydrogenase (short-subunit alcohol dehydrogenase family)
MEFMKMIPKTCLITGASRGLGAHLAESFWGAGWNIVLVARNREMLSRVVASLPIRREQAVTIFCCDLRCPEDVNNLVVKLAQQFPKLDTLINNAAIHGPVGPLTENSMAFWSDSIQVNLLSPVALCHGLIGNIADAGGGSIINISGGGATAPRAHFTAYASAKAALVRFSESLAQEVISLNIRVNCIAPGAMKTSLLEEVVSLGANVSGKNEFEIAKKVITQGGTSMDKVSELALFLADEISLGISGKLISANWDKWQEWPKHLAELSASDAYTLRRISGRDRSMEWGDV